MDSPIPAVQHTHRHVSQVLKVLTVKPASNLTVSYKVLSSLCGRCHKVTLSFTYIFSSMCGLKRCNFKKEAASCFSGMK